MPNLMPNLMPRPITRGIVTCAWNKETSGDDSSCVR